MQSTLMDDCYFIDPGCSLESAERTSTQVTRRANRKKHLTVLYIVEHPNQEGDTCIDWTSQYCWTNGWNCLWRGHSVYWNRPLIPHTYSNTHCCTELTRKEAPHSFNVHGWLYNLISLGLDKKHGIGLQEHDASSRVNALCTFHVFCVHIPSLHASLSGHHLRL